MSKTQPCTRRHLLNWLGKLLGLKADRKRDRQFARNTLGLAAAPLHTSTFHNLEIINLATRLDSCSQPPRLLASA